MLLTLDVGNSQIYCGVHDGDDLMATFRRTSTVRASSDEFGAFFRGMLREMKRGLLVTELLGQGVNLVTGDYSRGAAGYWVEGGEIAYPVEEITIAGNLREMFRQIAAIGADVLVRSGRATGSILLERMTIAGE